MATHSGARGLCCIAIAMVLVAAGCRERSRPAAAPAPKPETIEELKKAIATVLTRTHVPGVGIALVTKDHVIWTGGVGKTDLATGRDVTADTMFRIGSITKGFVALSLLKLQEEGKVDLNAKVADIVPEIKIVNPWDATDPVRIVNLLEHTAGFDDMRLAEMYDMRGGPEVPLLKTFEMFPQPQVVRWRPGTLQSYANPGYGLAGYIVEKIAGEPCETYIAETISRPLGMTHSDLRLTPEVKSALAQGYQGNPPRPVPYYPIQLRPAGEMKSSPAEMARFVRMMLNRGTLDGVKIVSPASITRMETPQTGLAARAGFSDGYGLANYAIISHPIRMQGHDGGLDGFLSSYAYLPEQGLGYFFSINANSSAFNEVGDLIYDYLTRGIAIPPKPRAVPLDAAIRASTGFYEYASPRNQMSSFITTLVVDGWTFIEDGKLYREGMIPGSREALIYLGNSQFRTDKESGAEGVYLVDQDGARYGCGPLSCFRRTNPIWPVTRFLLMAAALAIMATSILFAFVWVPRKVLGRMRGVRHLAVRIVPLLATVAFFALAVMFLGIQSFVSTMVLATPGRYGVIVCGLSLLFPVLSIIGLALALRPFEYPMNRVARIHSILVAIACTGVSAYLGYWGMIGVRLWKL